MERADAGKCRLHRLRLGAGDKAEALDAIVLALAVQLFKTCPFGLVGGDDELAAAGVRDPVRLAMGVEAPPALDAEPRLEAAGGVVDAGMDDLAVARRGLFPDAALRLHDQHRAAGQSQRAGDREADDPGADDGDIEIAHGRAWGVVRRESGVRPAPCSRST